MGKKLPPEVQKHIHRDLDVTSERVRAFGKEKYGVRIRVLSELRLVAGDRSEGTKLAIFALAISVVTFISRPADVDLQHVPWLALLLVNGVLALTAIVALSPVIVPASIHLGRQDRARVWLAAYEDEIQRRATR